ncbi:hypothetical protein B0H17DRAFT_1149766 [Mycena rosella]|uniref:Uncharacterized protein n=1 Tax=Mycena rosella TaxID=1033263 RepID=A0AAD7BYB2_MYCRO|nr:hypothetical protein B0H17DRAFT_1149766 [Mycena rosella]
MSTHISPQETHRLFGPINQPDLKINVRQRAVLRKVLELVHPDMLQAVFGQPTRLQVGIGRGYTYRESGKIKTAFDAEQAWHDWVVPYLATRNMPGRPAWALQPLAGLQMVSRGPRTAPAPQQAPTTPRHMRAPDVEAAPAPSTPCSVGPRLRPIIIPDSDDKATPCCPQKRKFLGVINISDSEEEDAARPPKKMRFLGVVDLTH